MEWMKVFVLVLQASIILMVLAIAMRSSWSDLTHLFRHPALLVKSLVARNLVMPVAAVALMYLFPLEPPVRVALVLLSITPVPPFLAGTQLKAGGRQEYTIGLLASHTMLAIVLVPVSLMVLNLVFETKLQFTANNVLKPMGIVLIPMVVGVLLRRTLRSSVANRAADVAHKVSMALLVVGALALLVLTANQIVTLIGDGTLVAFVLFTATGLLAGHLLGGPYEEDRTALALATPARHPGVAIAVAVANFPNQAHVAGAAVILYLLVEMLTARPYIARRAIGMEPDSLARSGLDRRHGSRATADRRRVVG
jgi:bile acid:Na+ symporter, BASS family